jgi:hypothetical protein
MTTLYLDTEFNGLCRGRPGELISMALVGPDGLSWYEAKHLCDLSLSGSMCAYEQWVAENVLPVLGTEQLSWADFVSSFREFIMRVPDPVIICDSHIDALHFCMLLNGDRDLPPLNLAFRIEVVRTPMEGIESGTPHNALSDAIALMRWHQRTLAKGEVMFSRGEVAR